MSSLYISHDSREKHLFARTFPGADSSLSILKDGNLLHDVETCSETFFDDRTESISVLE